MVDASQGVEAQTVANAFLASRHNLVIIPVINKIDLPAAQVEFVKANRSKMYSRFRRTMRCRSAQKLAWAWTRCWKPS